MTDACAALRRSADGLPPITLERVLSLAELQTRVDRKYLVRPDVFEQLLDGRNPDLVVLEIDGLRSFRYESMYFDTADHASYYSAATGRRSKFKVRTRTYVDSGQCMLEVKTEGGRGDTVKARMPYPLDLREQLDADGESFVAERVRLPGGARSLSAVLCTRYLRTTLVDLNESTRITCDARLECTAPTGERATMDDHVLVEVKSLAGVTRFDRMLWSLGQRPVSISKYCVGLALVHRHLPANRWNLTLRRYFGWTPDRSAIRGARVASRGGRSRAARC